MGDHAASQSGPFQPTGEELRECQQVAQRYDAKQHSPQETLHRDELTFSVRGRTNDSLLNSSFFELQLPYDAADVYTRTGNVVYSDNPVFDRALSDVARYDLDLQDRSMESQDSTYFSTASQFDMFDKRDETSSDASAHPLIPLSDIPYLTFVGTRPLSYPANMSSSGANDELTSSNSHKSALETRPTVHVTSNLVSAVTSKPPGQRQRRRNMDYKNFRRVRKCGACPACRSRHIKCLHGAAAPVQGYSGSSPAPSKTPLSSQIIESIKTERLPSDSTEGLLPPELTSARNERSPERNSSSSDSAGDNASVTPFSILETSPDILQHPEVQSFFRDPTRAVLIKNGHRIWSVHSSVEAVLGRLVGDRPTELIRCHLTQQRERGIQICDPPNTLHLQGHHEQTIYPADLNHSGQIQSSSDRKGKKRESDSQEQAGVSPNDEEFSKAGKRRKRNRPTNEETPRYHCPYCVIDRKLMLGTTLAQTSCGAAPGIEGNYLLQHINRTHSSSKGCPRCKTEWTSQQQNAIKTGNTLTISEHQRNLCDDNRPVQYSTVPVLDANQERRYQCATEWPSPKPGGDYDDRFRAIYRVLWPHATVPAWIRYHSISRVVIPMEDGSESEVAFSINNSFLTQRSRPFLDDGRAGGAEPPAPGLSFLSHGIMDSAALQSTERGPEIDSENVGPTGALNHGIQETADSAERLTAEMSTPNDVTFEWSSAQLGNPPSTDYYHSPTCTEDRLDSTASAATAIVAPPPSSVDVDNATSWWLDPVPIRAESFFDNNSIIQDETKLEEVLKAFMDITGFGQFDDQGT